MTSTLRLRTYVLNTGIRDPVAVASSAAGLRAAVETHTGFALFLAGDWRATTSDVITTLASHCIERGLYWMSAWGPDCSRVDDLFDWAEIGEDGSVDESTALSAAHAVFQRRDAAPTRVTRGEYCQMHDPRCANPVVLADLRRVGDLPGVAGEVDDLAALSPGSRETGSMATRHRRTLPRSYPDLASQWHDDLNGEVRPDAVSPGSDRRVWWCCPMGPDHVWEARVDARVASPGCPFCG